MSKDSTKSVSRDSDKFMLRLPDGMRDRIAKAAKSEGRSMNAEIVYVLQQFYDMSDHHDLMEDLYEQDQHDALDHIQPKSPTQGVSDTNLILASPEANAQLRSLLRQQLELMNRIVGSQPDEPFLKEDSQSIKKAAATQRKSRAKRPLTDTRTINDIPTLANAPTLVDVPTLGDLPSLSDDTKPRRIKRTPPKPQSN